MKCIQSQALKLSCTLSKDVAQLGTLVKIGGKGEKEENNRGREGKKRERKWEIILCLVLLSL